MHSNKKEYMLLNKEEAQNRYEQNQKGYKISLFEHIFKV